MHSAFRQAGVKQRPGEIGAASLLWDCPWHGQDEDVSLRHPHVVPVLVPPLGGSGAQLATAEEELAPRFFRGLAAHFISVGCSPGGSVLGGRRSPRSPGHLNSELQKGLRVYGLEVLGLGGHPKPCEL